MKSYGRAPTFLLLTGYEQARSVAAALAGDWEAARRVELELPETGVCSGPVAAGGAEVASCCGPAASVNPASSVTTLASGTALATPVSARSDIALDLAPSACCTPTEKDGCCGATSEVALEPVGATVGPSCGCQ
jgi:hypothetical protein